MAIAQLFQFDIRKDHLCTSRQFIYQQVNTQKPTPQVHSPIDRDTNEQLHHVRELGIYAVLHLADLRAPTILGIKTHHS